ncbi:MAG: hypothetical protein L6R38_003724 [Xanthoria sp. 2 TBL-2021]|nr:MAG: hypothetical protein L6R38_003724 [Xanthoria sp. 2 TBL-2021]
MDHPVAKHPADIEKSAGTLNVSSRSTSDENLASEPAPPIPIPPKLRTWNQRIENLAGLEARGIKRVLPEERHAASGSAYAQMAMLWFSANISANNLAVGLLGPLLFGLGFTDSAMCAFGGILVGSAATAYMSIWGAQSGNRTMIVLRYFMGYWPAKLPCLLNMILMIGYGTIDCIIGGQILSAVSGGSMSIVVGIVIVALISWVIAVFGMALFQKYERYAWAPQLFVLLILIGSAGRSFNASLQSTDLLTGEPLTGGPLTAARLSFFSLQLSVPVSWSAASSDFYVYYPENTRPWKSFSLTMLGLTLSFMFVNLIGIGLGSGTFANPAWLEADGISSGALILAGYDGLGEFGRFCGVIIALGLINNNVPGTYASALGFQVLGRYGKMVPRYLWVCVIVLIYFVCAVAGRNNLFDILSNFVALMGYWTMIMVAIVLEEHLIFRRGKLFDWTAWEDKKALPLGIAAMVAFLLGWVGAITGMYQHWYIGPVAIKVGGVGADIGVWLGCAFAMVVFVPLRWWELRRFGR